MQGYNSKEELYFSWYLQELKDRGFIHSFEYEGMTINLATTANTHWHKRLKTKVKKKERNMIQGISYVPDFVIRWNDAAKGVFIDDEANGCVYMPYFIPNINIAGDPLLTSIVDTKGDYDPNNMNRLFEVKRKWIWSHKGIYVQKIVPHKLFKATFTPRRYLFTDITKKPRKLSYEPRTLDEFLKTMRYEGPHERSSNGPSGRRSSGGR